ncbi:MAG: hypothetical protein K2P81_15065 [Bacteriovoracaceae bacterium]|nr:hypothetical protein [Bacteriovoracaceae bacterium]
MRLATLVLPALLLTTACSMKKNMDEMHDKTVQMAQTTENLGESTSETKDLLGWVATLQKQGDGFQVRNNAFHNIIESESINKKIESAIAYMYAFEFQLVSFSKIKGVDLQKLRELLAAQAVAELGKTLPEILPEGTKWPLDATKTDNNNESLMAISAVLHRINYLQTQQVSVVGLRPLSMLDLLSESLMKKAELNEGKIKRSDLTDLDKEVLREEQIFSHMLKLRYKTLPVIALARISHLKDGILNKLGMLFFR